MKPRLRFTQDHPRSRGEYSIRLSITPTREGSSPLSRGIPAAVVDVEAHGRIIPALAGNTLFIFSLTFGNQDHPRSRGEYGDHMPRRTKAHGSSPLSRGILLCSVCEYFGSGIIPALAGNTFRTG